MNREFLEFYNRELSILKEQGKEFAEEYPGVAERLGGLIGDRVDPMIAGLLEGSAFLAARVQLKIKHEFADFTTNLLDQLVPHYLAPTPSFLLAQARPKFGDPALREGREIARGAYFDATYREMERNIACRFRLVSPITLWPLEVAKAEYFASAGPLQALMSDVIFDGVAGLRLSLNLRAAARVEDEPPDAEAHQKPELRVSECRIPSLRFHLLGQESDAVALYEQLFAHCRGVYFRVLDSFGDPVVFGDPAVVLRQIGFDEADELVPNDRRMFRGFDFLRDYFAFPRRFLGFDLDGLGRVIKRLKAKSVDILFAFDDVNPRLSAAVRPEMFALFAAPAANLFEKTLDRIPVKSNQHEYHVVPDRSRALDFETNRILKVYAHIPGVPQKSPVEPLYTAAAGQNASGLCYTMRRLPRRRSGEEKRYGLKSDYTGTDTFLSLGESADPDERHRVALADREMFGQVAIRAEGKHAELGDAVTFVGIGGFGTGDGATTGQVAWRLVNMLGLNHLGLVARAAGESGLALREMLALFADASDSATERKIRGLRSLDSQAIVRRVRYPQGSSAARGLEVTVTLEDKAFEGSGAFLLGAVLDRFFAEYVAINHFTQTVVRTPERGEIMRWPTRMGLRGVL